MPGSGTQDATAVEPDEMGLKRLALFVGVRPRLVWLFKWPKRVARIESWYDMDHAGCIRTRKSVSGSSVSSSSSSENNVGNDVLFVIGLHGSRDTVALFLLDWEVAKVALSCHIALDMLCQEMHEVERRRGWFGF